jgi:hypothetical protein
MNGEGLSFPFPFVVSLSNHGYAQDMRIAFRQAQGEWAAREWSTQKVRG